MSTVNRLHTFPATETKKPKKKKMIENRTIKKQKQRIRTRLNWETFLLILSQVEMCCWSLVWIAYDQRKLTIINSYEFWKSELNNNFMRMRGNSLLRTSQSNKKSALYLFMMFSRKQIQYNVAYRFLDTWKIHLTW